MNTALKTGSKNTPNQSTPRALTETERHANALRTEFVYQPHPQLPAARARHRLLLADLQRAGQQQADLRAALDTAQAAFLKAQTGVALGEATEADVEQARQAFEAAQTDLRANQANGGQAVRNEARNLAARIEQLERDEIAQNEQRLRPLYREQVARMNAALEEARAASDAIRALRVAGGEVAHYWPGEWPELTAPLVYGAINSTHLDEWRQQAQALGLLD